MKTDVVVIGCGGAGMCAAVSVAQQGKRVTVFEKASVIGGNSIFPRGGTFAVGSKYQKNLGIEFGVDDVYRVIMNYTHYRANAPLLRAFLEKSASTVEWIEALGGKFRDVPEMFVKFTTADGGYPTGVPIEGTGKDIVAVLKKNLDEMGVPIYTETRVNRILMKDNRVSGVEITTATGEKQEVVCEAVIIATGGFGNSPDMVREYTGFELNKNIFTLYNKNVVGDGHKMAWEVGAGKDGMGCQIIFGVTGAGFQSRGLPCLQQEPQLIVNQHGKRFMDESLSNPTYKGNLIASQPEGCCYLIFDNTYKEEMEEMGFAVPNFFFSADALEDFDQTIEELTRKGNTSLFSGETLEELCEKTGIWYENLKATIERYNELCEWEEDLDFGKNSFFLNPVKKGKFYAVKMFPTMYGTIGGIKVNEKLEVVDSHQVPISGLYAAGYDANGCLGAPVPDYTMITPGLTFGFALNSGRMAGEAAVVYVTDKN